MPELPNDPWGQDFDALCKLVAQYDLVIVQRCYKLQVVKLIRMACDITGRKMVFETDDDYFNLPPTNPCYPEMQLPGVLDGYKEILQMADLITVSTKELKDTLYMYNKNIEVFPNNLETVFCGYEGKPLRAYSKEQVDEQGKVRISQVHGLVGIPAFWENPQDNSRNRVVRIGYTGTPSHHEDFGTIHRQLEKFMEKYASKVWLVFIGDKWFFDKMIHGKGRTVHVPVSQYDLYMYHLRNLDVGLAPLAPNLFNMSKSPIKAVEYGSWGIPAVLPHYVTYTRDFTNRKDCLTYYNSREFYDVLEEIVFNHELREQLGQAARDTVRDNRLEHLHAARRFAAYQSLVEQTVSPKVFEVAR